jgi:lysophospholipase L1-like esterase
MPRSFRMTVVAAFFLVAAIPVFAQSPQQFANDATRYMALGDSIAAGYKAMPVTNGYTFRLYQDAVFDTIPHTLFNAAAVPGATSADVLQYQVPQAVIPFAIGGFNPKYITLTVGGDDLLAILAFVEENPDASEDEISAFAQEKLGEYAANLQEILNKLTTKLPDAKIFVSNQYNLPQIQAVLPVTDTIVGLFNGIVQQVTDEFSLNNVYLVDVHAAFLGRNNLIEGQRAQVSIFEVHPTNVGQRVIEQAFADVIAADK